MPQAAPPVRHPAVLTGPGRGGPAEDAGLVDANKLDPSIAPDFRYATADNLTGQPVYPSTAQCYSRRNVAQRLVAVQAGLKTQGLGLKVYDCYRPFNI